MIILKESLDNICRL